ncbi:hypothetical protein ACBT_0136 [Aliarcobacter cibarius]|uniref:PcfJ-like protein n=1 Tax=Aliarcobacter cibarius TaxID=255507 RepID=A0A7L5JLQ6_9BACT|nr:PcfJ domain-containing protein [Aliarcobacter cibarius]QKJ26121.1 hypothetical protein ACBT_0136 [Aliarcobacter cibarius]
MNTLSWHLNLNINSVRNLFSQIELPYEIDCYVCSCGHNEIIIKEQKGILDYICLHCENEFFCNANFYNNNHSWYEPIYELFDEDFILYLKPNVYYDENNKIIRAAFQIKVPKTVDLASNKIIYTDKDIFELEIDQFGNYKEQLHTNFNLNGELTEKEIMFYKYVSQEDLINRNFYLTEYKKSILKELKNCKYAFNSKVALKTSNLKEYCYFIKHNNLLDLEFFKWKNVEILPKDEKFTILKALDFVMNYRKEKSLKKLVFDNYKFQMKEYKSYDLVYIYSITRNIKDINILNRMMNLDFYLHREYINHPTNLCQFIKFLTKNFSEKQIEKLFISYKQAEMFWLNDSVLIFFEIANDAEDLVLSKCKKENIHNDIIKYHQMLLTKKDFDTTFEFDDKFLKACTNILDYEIKLPTNGIELYDWSNKLQNCLSGYCRIIKEKQTIVYGFFKDSVIKFAVEIQDNKIFQSKSKYNQDLQDKEMSLVNGWFKEYFEEKISTENSEKDT